MAQTGVRPRKGVKTDRESTITILTTLKNFYDEEIFGLFIKEFYNVDQEVSLAAIKASASIGNEAAITHLYKIIETGSEVQRIEAVRALAEIKAPSSVERLIKYFNLFEVQALKEELLSALNHIAPFSEAVQELDKAILVSPAATDDLLRHAVLGLLSAKNLTSIR